MGASRDEVGEGNRRGAWVFSWQRVFVLDGGSWITGAGKVLRASGFSGSGAGNPRGTGERKMRIARAMWVAVLAICLEIPDVVAQECRLVAAGAATDGHGGFTTLDGASAVSTFVRDGSTYAIVAAFSDNGIQIMDVSDPSNPVPVSSATDVTELRGANAVSTFERGGSTYAIVTAFYDDGIQIMDVSDPSNPVPVSSATDGEGGFTELRGANAVSTFERGESTYAIVAAIDDDGIQIVDVSDPSNPVPVSSATDGEGGFTTLDGASVVSTFERGKSTYAIVAARDDDGIQIVDVSDPSNPVPVSSATDGQGGFTELRGANAVSTFERGGSTYAIVAAGSDNGIQIVDVSDPSNPVPVSSATDGEGGFTELRGAYAVSTFERGGSTYAIVAAGSDNGIQIVSIPDCGARVPAFDCLSIPSDPCAVCADPCANVDCGAHGSCSGGRCVCESGAYTGDRCQDRDACFGLDLDCGSHGSCSSRTGQCVCESGAYTGDHCQNFDACFGISCGQHGSCLRGRCTCNSGAYTGDRCQNYDACYGIDCGAHGICSRGQCVCESGAYTGDHCQNFDACYGIDCGQHGSCSGGTCVCESGAYSGFRCQNYDNCFGIDCGAHGTCSDGTCACENDAVAYTGERCDTCVWEGDGQGVCYGKGLRPHLPMSTSQFV
eukprot:COSAG02_NODE_3198_length_7186_cov_9.288557_5_plen_664_part_00